MIKARLGRRRPGDPGPGDRIPEFCPVLGVKLESGTKKYHDASPSLDRMIPSKGYVPGNVVVMSFRANRIKGDASREELQTVIDWMDAQQIPWNKAFKGLTEVDGVVWENQGAA